MGAAQDINAAINKTDARPIRLAYGYATPTHATGPAEMAELDQGLRSARSIDLSTEVRRENERAYARAVEQWLQAHLAVEVRRCPG